MTTTALYNPLPVGEDELTVPFAYINQNYVKVYKRLHADGLDQIVFDGTELVAGVDYSWLNAGTIQLVDPADGLTDYLVKRSTPTDPLTTQQPNVLSSSKINLVDRQCLNVAEEAVSTASDAATKAEEISSRTLRAPEGEVVASLPAKATRANKFLVWDADGNPSYSAGTGTDTGLRDALADAATGGDLLRTTNPRAITSPAILSIRDILYNREPWVDDWYGPDTDRLTNMLADEGHLQLRGREYTLEESILIPSGAAGRKKWRGEGMEASIIKCQGMTGQAAIKLATPSGLYRVQMADFRVYGDCDTAIDLSGQTLASDQVYASDFQNLWLQSQGDSCFKAGNNFSMSMNNVHAASDVGDSFELKGDIARLLENCYAHKAGTGRAGYRIWGQAILINCNGLDQGGDIWGDFGAAVSAGDSVNSQFQVSLQGCNLEDWAVKAIRLRYTGSLELDHSRFIPKALSLIHI